MISNTTLSNHSSLKQRVCQPFTLYYKISTKSEMLHAIIYSGGIDFFINKNFPSLHKHDYFELLYVLEGELIHKIENISYTYKKGDACLLNRNTFHCDIPGNNCTVVFINISTDYINDIFKNNVIYNENGDKFNLDSKIKDFIFSNINGENAFSKNCIEFHPVNRESKSAAFLIDLIQQELISQTPGCFYILKGLLTRLLFTLENPNKYNINFMQLDSSNEEFLYNRITTFLKENNGHITRSDLSRELNYNAEYLNQVIKKHCGKTIIQLARQYRLEKAKQLLLETDNSISTIITMLGFASNSHFYRFFHKETGMSPTDFRNSKQN